jgi:hypothetical protein
MSTNNVRAIALISVGLLLLGNIVFAVIIQDTVRLEQPIRAIHGRVSNHGNAIPSVWVDVYDQRAAITPKPPPASTSIMVPPGPAA